MLTPNPILESARVFREALTGGQSQAAARMLRLYQALVERFEPNLRVVLDEMAGDADAVTTARLFEKKRLNLILEQLASDMADYEKVAQSIITERQRAAIELAQKHARQFSRQALEMKANAPKGFSGPTWETVDRPTLENLVGITADGAPFGDELGKLAGQNVERVRDILLRNAASGEQPETMVASVRDDLGGRVGRFLTVARTAEMHAYTASMMASYEENADVVKGWRWHSSLSFDTCLACLALHGKEFPMGAPMERHFNCRCMAIPIVATWEELGYPELEEIAPTWMTGEAWLQSQSEENQRHALGRSRFELYKNGDVALDDFLGRGEYPQWGGMFFERSTKDALAQRAPQKPEMSREEAALWAADSVYSKRLTHLTGEDNSANIRKNGFDLNRNSLGRVWGNGVYSTFDPATREMYEMWVAPPFEHLELVINVKKVMTVEISNGSTRIEPIIEQLPGGQGRFEELVGKFFERGARGMAPRARALTQMLVENDYDALEIIEPKPTGGVGGSQIVVFDSQNVVLVKASNKTN